MFKKINQRRVVFGKAIIKLEKPKHGMSISYELLNCEFFSSEFGTMGNE